MRLISKIGWFVGNIPGSDLCRDLIPGGAVLEHFLNQHSVLFFKMLEEQIATFSADAKDQQPRWSPEFVNNAMPLVEQRLHTFISRDRLDTKTMSLFWRKRERRAISEPFTALKQELQRM